jgi:DNA-binding HxlR family transcriptional regulator
MNQSKIDTTEITKVTENADTYLQIAFEDLHLEVVGRRWALLILRNLHTKEAVRFNELKRLMPGISSTVLANRLLEMECEGLISKKIYPEIPPRVEYRLTDRARELG